MPGTEKWVQISENGALIEQSPDWLYQIFGCISSLERIFCEHFVKRMEKLIVQTMVREVHDM